MRLRTSICFERRHIPVYRQYFYIFDLYFHTAYVEHKVHGTIISPKEMGGFLIIDAKRQTAS